MSIKKPKISVCIPTYNRTDLLMQSVESVLAQNFTDYELIISDNASQDATVAVIKAFTDPRIVYIRQKKNIGLVNNWNHCLAAAKGEYISIFHDDDLMLPENLSLKVRALDLNRNVGLVHSNFHIIDENGIISKERAHFIESQDIIETGSSFLRSSLLGFNRVNPPSVVIRRECFSKVGGFSNRLHFTTDYEYWMRISMYYDVMYLGEPLIKYRMYHNNEWTSSKYLIVTDGSQYSNLMGLREEYIARKMILKQARFASEDRKKINNLVRKRMTESIKRLIEKQYLKDGKSLKAFKAIAEICMDFPDLIFEKNTAKLYLKALLGSKITEAIKMTLNRR